MEFCDVRLTPHGGLLVKEIPPIYIRAVFFIVEGTEHLVMGLDTNLRGLKA